ncbi:MAG: hypothetical protein ACI944_001414 [Natronomonas sp.]
MDPNAPLRGIESFTPPLLGPYAVANISGFAWFGPGGYMTLVAVALLAVAYLARDLDATVDELPELAREFPGALRDRDEGSSDESERDRDADRNPEIGGGDHVR